MRIFLALTLCSILLFANIDISKAWQNVELLNNGIKASSADVTHAELKKSSAQSMYLPSISVTGSYTHLSEPVNVDTAELSGALSLLPIPIPFPTQVDLTEQDIFFVDLHMLWPLYVGGKIDAAQDIYSAQVSEKKATHQMKKDTEFLKLIKYYYGVVLANSLYTTRLEAQKALYIHYTNAQKMQEQGQVPRIEVLNAQVKFSAAQIDETKAKHKLQIAKSALYSLTKSALQPGSKLFVNKSMQSENYYKKETQDNYAGLKVLDAKASQSASLIDIQEASWMPEVVAYANYNLYKDDSPITSTLPTWFAGVMIKIDILQRKDRSQEIQAARILNKKVHYLKVEAIDNLALLVEKTYKEMLAFKEEYNSLNTSLELAQENYKLRSIAFKEGLSTSVELVDAQIFLMASKTKRLNAAYNFVQKVAQLSVLSGNRDVFFELESSSQEIK